MSEVGESIKFVVAYRGRVPIYLTCSSYEIDEDKMGIRFELSEPMDVFYFDETHAKMFLQFLKMVYGEQ